MDTIFPTLLLNSGSRTRLRPAAAGTLLLAALLIAGLALALSPAGPAHAQATDYDADDDGLISVSNLAQLNAIRWDLDGDGSASDAGYATAFSNPAAGMGCPTSGCVGYELTANLDFDTNGNGIADSGDEHWNGDSGWLPVASHDGAGFNAIFDGNGHTISNLYVNRGHGRLGLFGTVADSGVVRNVGLQDVDVSGQGHNMSGLAGLNQGTIANSRATGSVEGGDNVGLLVGENRGGVITDSSAAGTVWGLSKVGGLVGLNSHKGKIERSRATGTVSGRNAVGGLLGTQNSGAITRFGHATASVTGTRSGGSSVGGLVGLNSGHIIASHAAGTTSGHANDTGGLVGFNKGPGTRNFHDPFYSGFIRASYATGRVSSSGSNIGGLVGRNLGSIRASYATGQVSGGSNMGGLAGRLEGHRVTDSYWDTTTSGLVTSPAGTGTSTTALQTPTGYTGIYANWNLSLYGNGIYTSPRHPELDTRKDDPWDFGTSSHYPQLKTDYFVANGGSAHPIGSLATGVNFTATADLTTDSADDLSLLTLTAPAGVAMSPSFQSSVDEYSLTVPADMERLAFSGGFTSLAGRSERTAFGLLAVGTSGELDAAIDSRSGRPAETIFAASSDGAARTRVIALDAPGSTTTVEIRVYKKLSGRTDEWPLQASENSVVKTYTLTVTREDYADADATLRDLNISMGLLNFDPATAAYAVKVPPTVDSVIITPTASAPGATVTVAGASPSTPVELDYGENVIEVVVTAADGNTTKTYVITVTRPRTRNVQFTAVVNVRKTTTDDMALTGLALPEGVTIEPAFRPDHYSYTVAALGSVAELSIDGDFTTPWPQWRDYTAYVLVSEDLAQTEIDWDDRSKQVRYGHQTGPPKLVGVMHNKSFEFPETIALMPGATTTVEIGIYKWKHGRAHDSPFTETSVKKVYTLEVTRGLPAEDDARLWNLTISDGWLDFDPDATSYTVYVTRDTESVVLTPTTLHPDATVTVNGSAPATAVTLNKGGNDIPIVVTAADGIATTTYQVTVFRGATHDYSAFVAQMYEWRNNPQWSSYKAHTDRWDRALLAFGESVADTTLKPLTAAEAQAFADRGSAWYRWVSVADALRDIEANRAQRQQQQQEQRQQQQQATSTVDTVPQDSDPPNQAPVVASVLPDVSGLEAGATRDVSLSGVFDDADGDALTISAASSDEAVATVSVASGGSTLTVTGVAQGTATITVTAQDSGGNRVSDAFEVSVVGKYATLISRMYEWRNDPQWVSYKSHTDRWDRALLAFGEAVSDTSLTPMTAAEAQGFADQNWGTRWVDVAAALREIESSGQQQQQEPVNQAPTVSSSLSDVTIVNESRTRSVSLSGVFDDPDNDALTISAGSSNESVATVSVSSDGSSLTVTARARGTATITVTSDDGNGGTVSDTFTVRVKAAPVVASSLTDMSGLEVGATRDVSLSGVFSDADGDALTITAGSSNESIATVSTVSGGSTLTVTGAAQGEATITVTARDSDGNRVSDAFDVAVTQAVEPEPTPTPTPTPTPEPDPTPTPTPDSSSLSGAAARYDANGDGTIDVSEYRQAARDYTARRITYSELLEVIRAYMGSG